MSILKNYTPNYFCSQSQLENIIAIIQKVINITIDSVEFSSKSKLTFYYGSNFFVGDLSYDLDRLCPKVSFSKYALQDLMFIKNCDDLIKKAREKIELLYSNKHYSFSARTSLSFNFYEQDFEGVYYVFSSEEFKRFVFTPSDLVPQSNCFLKFLCYKVVYDKVVEIDNYEDIYKNIDQLIKVQEMIDT